MNLVAELDLFSNSSSHHPDHCLIHFSVIGFKSPKHVRCIWILSQSPRRAEWHPTESQWFWRGMHCYAMSFCQMCMIYFSLWKQYMLWFLLTELLKLGFSLHIDTYISVRIYFTVGSARIKELVSIMQLLEKMQKSLHFVNRTASLKLRYLKPSLKPMPGHDSRAPNG